MAKNKSILIVALILVVLIIAGLYFRGGTQSIVAISNSQITIAINNNTGETNIISTFAVSPLSGGDQFVLSPSLSDLNSAANPKGYAASSTFTLSGQVTKEQCVASLNPVPQPIQNVEIKDFDVTYPAQLYGSPICTICENTQRYTDVINFCKNSAIPPQSSTNRKVESGYPIVGAYFKNYQSGVLGDVANCFVYYKYKNGEAYPFSAAGQSTDWSVQLTLKDSSDSQSTKTINKGDSGVSFDLGSGKFAEIKSFDSGFDSGQECSGAGTSLAVTSGGTTFADNQGIYVRTGWDSYKTAYDQIKALDLVVNNMLSSKPSQTTLQTYQASIFSAYSSFYSTVTTTNNIASGFNFPLIQNGQLRYNPASPKLSPAMQLWTNSAVVSLQKISGIPQLSSVIISPNSAYAGQQGVLTFQVKNIGQYQGTFKITYSCPNTELSGSISDTFDAGQTKTETFAGKFISLSTTSNSCTVTVTDTTDSSKTSTASSNSYGIQAAKTCTGFASWDSISGSCKCNAPPTPSGQSLVQTDTDCHFIATPPSCRQLKPNEVLKDPSTCDITCINGYSYDILSNCVKNQNQTQASCNYGGQVLESGKCVSGGVQLRCNNGNLQQDTNCNLPAQGGLGTIEYILIALGIALLLGLIYYFGVKRR